MRLIQTLSVGMMVPLMMAAQPEPKIPGQQPRTTDSTMGKEDPGLRDDLVAQEKRIWEAMKAKDWTTFESYLSDDFTLVCSKGFQDKSKGLEMVREGSLNSYNLSDWRVNKLGADSAVVLYKAECDGSGPDGKNMKMTGFVSTIWTKKSGKWQAQVHQMIKEDGAQGR